MTYAIYELELEVLCVMEWRPRGGRMAGHRALAFVSIEIYIFITICIVYDFVHVHSVYSVRI